MKPSKASPQYPMKGGGSKMHQARSKGGHFGALPPLISSAPSESYQ